MPRPTAWTPLPMHSRGIGRLNERALHAALKRWYARPGDELEVPIHIHLHETRDEVVGSLREHGARPIERLHRLGIEPVVSDEVFGPVACLDAYEDFEQALLMANDSRYGLQAGIFTNDVGKIQHAWRHLEVGGVIAGDIPTFRVDRMPYGGVKASGFGREGLRSAIREMCEPH